MIELFIRSHTGNEYVYRTDQVDISTLKGQQAECYTVYNPNSYKGLIDRYLNNRTVAMCSDSCLVEHKPLTPESAAEALLTYWDKPVEQGGFRLATDSDIIQAKVYMSYKKLIEHQQNAKQDLKAADAILPAHPLFAKLISTGLDSYNSILFMAYLVDPRRFINLSDTKDRSKLHEYININKRPSIKELHTMVMDPSYIPVDTDMLMWMILMFTWAPDSGVIDSLSSVTNLDYWISRYWDHFEHYEDIGESDTACDYKARIKVTHEVYNYIMMQWNAELKTGPAFDPKFFAYKNMTNFYRKEFQ